MIPYEFEQKSRCFRVSHPYIYRQIQAPFATVLQGPYVLCGWCASRFCRRGADVSSTVENATRYAAAVNRDATQLLGFAEELARTIPAKVRGCLLAKKHNPL
jgi:hypothetical protein